MAGRTSYVRDARDLFALSESCAALTLRNDGEVLATSLLLRDARKYRVPVPRVHTNEMEFSDDWEQSWDGAMYLSEPGYLRLRAAIRKEKIERVKEHAHLFQYAAALTGIIGAVTGLIAVLTELRQVLALSLGLQYEAKLRRF